MASYRMWAVNPAGLCAQHLVVEHDAMHWFLRCIRTGIALNYAASVGLFRADWLVRRHDALAQELTVRGYVHATPVSIDKTVFAVHERGCIRHHECIADLTRLCHVCALQLSLLEREGHQVTWTP